MSEESEEELRKRKRRDRSILLRGIAIFFFIAFVFMPFARWYSLIAGAVGMYNYTEFEYEILDERIEREVLAWTGVVRAVIVVGVIAMSVVSARLIK